MSVGIQAERLFAELCNKQFLPGFVFHSPRFYDPDEKEVGDVVLWVRHQVIAVEVLRRSPDGGTSTKKFIRRIGEKRDQLLKDYEVFSNSQIDIELVNEQKEKVDFRAHGLATIAFSGIVLVDCDNHIDKLHFKTIEKSLSLPFPVAIMTKDDFLNLLSEIDTIPDLIYYLHDRYEFVKEVYPSSSRHFLNLNNRLEKNLISFYKTHENNFLVSQWMEEDALDYHRHYIHAYRERIDARNAENSESYVIDDIINILRSNNRVSAPTLLHSWELGVMTRRQRAGTMSSKIRDAFERMVKGNPQRQFAFWNQTTECWLVFLFHYGDNSELFRLEAEMQTQYKLFKEMKEQDFEFSVFGYAFRKSSLGTDGIFDEIMITIEDAADYDSISETDYRTALEYFGKLRPQRITEFPK